MPFGITIPPALSSLTRSLFAQRWRAHSLLTFYNTNAPTRGASYSSIAHAMLKRAVKAKATEPLPPNSKNDAKKAAATPNNLTRNGNIQESLKPKPSQAIGGFVQPLRPASANGKLLPKESQSTVISSVDSSRMSSLFSRDDAFQDTQNSSFDLVQLADEFSEDDDIDFDYSYTLPTQPLSSAQTWSSSPPANKGTPPGALKRREREREREQLAAQSVVVVEDDEAPKSKRRTLPWKLGLSEQDEVSHKQEQAEESSSEGIGSSAVPTCFKCRKTGHYANNCPTNGKGKPSEWAFSPLPHDKKDKHMPWNTTASKVAEERRAVKEMRKRKIDKAEKAAAESHGRTRTAKLAPIQLTDEQTRVKDLVVDQGKSVFFTGSAGTGKSVLMRSIIAALKKKYVREGDRVAVTASTGLAACNIGGVTLHSFGGIGLGKEDVPTLIKKIKKNNKAKLRWTRTKVLVIDEISMVDGDLFDKLEEIARGMRNNGRPFGGVKFAFDAATWGTAIHHTIGLTEVFRQKDPVFANMLNEMRLGKVSQDTIKAFVEMKRAINYEDDLTATELFPTRNEVENSNTFRLRNLHGKAYRFEAADSGSITDEGMREKLLSNMMAPKSIELKKGAQVMLIKNMDDGLVNGSLGKVVAFMSEKSFEIYDANPDILNEKELSDAEEENHRQSDLAKFKQTNKELPITGVSNHGRLFPLVRFSIPDGTVRDLLVQPEDWKIELPNGEVQAQRSQLPLILAWALSIHKAQGQTLERVKIDLKRVFENGQAYVALSRATSQAGLEVQNFDPKKVMAHPRVAEFYNSLYSVNKALAHPRVARADPPKIPTKPIKPLQDDDFFDEGEEIARQFMSGGRQWEP
ncbi:DNA repair and recombination protein PIF1 [Botrytis cinerea]